MAPLTPGRCFTSQKGPLYGASRESSVGIATLKEPVTQNRRERNLLLNAIVIFSEKREKISIKLKSLLKDLERTLHIRVDRNSENKIFVRVNFVAVKESFLSKYRFVERFTHCAHCAFPQDRIR